MFIHKKPPEMAVFLCLRINISQAYIGRALMIYSILLNILVLNEI